jgi:hypothetical protein
LIDDVALQPDRRANREDQCEWGSNENQSKHHRDILRFIPPSYLGV